MSTNKVLSFIIVLLLIATGVYFFVHSNQKTSTTTSKKTSVPLIAKVPTLGALPENTQNLTPADNVAFTTLSSWVSIAVTNQPTITKNPQKVRLPVGWTAREDYLLTVLPSTLPASLKNYRGIIMRPEKSKSMSRDDAIYTIEDISNAYFKDHCRPSGALFVCYSGNNTETKAVFDLLLYFNK